MNRKPYIIGITGGSGSGKTTFIEHLELRFDKSHLCVVSQDDYYFPRENQLIDENGITNFDLLESIDIDQLYQDVQKLCQGESIERLEYTFNNENKTPQVKKFNPAKVLVVEGIFAFNHKALFDLMDLKLFVHADDNLKVIRRIKRDAEERNYPLDDVLYRYEKHVMPTYQKHIAPFINEVDLVINNNNKFDSALKVIEVFIKSL